jgi:hypothetical protein
MPLWTPLRKAIVLVFGMCVSAMAKAVSATRDASVTHVHAPFQYGSAPAYGSLYGILYYLLQRGYKLVDTRVDCFFRV